MPLFLVTILSLLILAGAGQGSTQTSSDPPPDKIFSSDQILTSLFGAARAVDPRERVSVNLPTVTFDFNSARLTPQGRRQLDELARAFEQGRLIGRPVTIAGHTDARGSVDYNRALSVRRAEAAKDYLAQEHNWPVRLMNPVGHGMSQLLGDKSRYSPEQRRVEIILEPVRQP